MNNKTLGIILIILVAVFLLTKFLGNNKNRSFKEEIVQIDTARVDKVVIHPRDKENPEFSLEKTDGKWFVKNDQKTVPASKSSVNSLMRTIALIQAKQIVARSEEKWQEYEVDEENGVRIEVFDGDKKLEDFIIGRLYFNQQTRAALTYLRLSDEEDTYAIEGFLNANLNQDFDSYRVRNMIDLNQDDIHAFVLSNQSQIEQLNLRDNQWVNDEGVAVDSADMARYLSRVSKLYGSEFFDETAQQLGDAFQSMEIRANNTLTPVKVECFYHPRDTGAFVLHSSINESGYFKSPDSSGVYKTLFLDFIDLANPNDNL